MTDLIAKLDALADKATARPWEGGGVGYPDRPDPFTWIYGPRECPEQQSGRRIAADVPLPAAAFIIALANSYEALRAELLAAREVIDAMRTQNGSVRMYKALDDYDAARGEGK